MMFKFSVLKLKDFIKNYKKEHLILFLFYIIFIIFLYYFCNYDLPEIIIGYFNITLKADPLISIYRMFLLISLTYLTLNQTNYMLDLSIFFFFTRTSKSKIFSNIILSNMMYICLIFSFSVMLSLITLSKIDILMSLYELLFKLLICNLSLFLLSCKLKVLSVFILPLVYLYYNYITIPIYSLILLNLFVVYILYLNKNSLLVN